MKSLATRLFVVITVLSLSHGFARVARADFTRHIYSLTGIGPLDLRMMPFDPFDPSLGTLDRVDVSLWGITAATVYHPAFHPLYNPVGVFPLTLRHDLNGFGDSYFDFTVETIPQPVVVQGPATVMPPWFIDVRFSIDALTTTLTPSTFISMYPAFPPVISASLDDFYADTEPADDLLMYTFRVLAPTLVVSQAQHLLQIDYHYTPSPGPIGPISPIGPIAGLTGLNTDLTTQTLFPNLTSIHDLSENDLQALIALPVPAPGAVLLAALGAAFVAGSQRRRLKRSVHLVHDG